MNKLNNLQSIKEFYKSVGKPLTIYSGVVSTLIGINDNPTKIDESNYIMKSVSYVSSYTSVGMVLGLAFPITIPGIVYYTCTQKK